MPDSTETAIANVFKAAVEELPESVVDALAAAHKAGNWNQHVILDVLEKLFSEDQTSPD